MDNNHTLQTALETYITDPENPHFNVALGKEYSRIGQGAAAITYFLRGAERTDDSDLAYDCLMDIARWLDKQGNRDNSVQSYLKHCLVLNPHRSDAYLYYAQFHNYRKKYIEGYMMAHNGLLMCTDYTQESPKYGLIFEKGVAAWWWGKSQESRDLFNELVDVYWNDMTEVYQKAVESNITRLGLGDKKQAFSPYLKETDYDRLRFKFDGSHKIEKKLFSGHAGHVCSGNAQW